MTKFTYLSGYPENLLSQVKNSIENKTLGTLIFNKYPKKHDITTDKALYNFTMDIKNSFLKKSESVSKIIYDSKIRDIRNALGTHTFVSRVQGSKLKAKREIRVSTIFKNVPLEFLTMIVVHELAHLREKEHNKSFYKLCEYMEPDYHQLEFDVRLYLTHVDLFGKLY